MTDFVPESSFPTSGLAQIVWGTDADAPPAPPRPAAPRSAPALAAAANQLLEAMVLKRLPRMESVRQKLQHTRAATSLAAIAEAVQDLHARTGALDFLAGRSGGDKAADFLQQGTGLAQASERLEALAAAFVERHATQGPVARLLWIELVLESDSLRKRVRQGAHWLAQMDRDLVARRAAATMDVTHRALEELARRGQGLHQRLQTVHRLCGQARSVHTLCEQLAEQRTALCHTLQGQVRPAAALLQETLQPLLEAAGYRPLVPEELMEAIEARHQVQVCLTHAAAQIVRLQGGDEELSAQLAGMEQKTGSLA